jgi:leucyl-tRNA synthetase
MLAITKYAQRLIDDLDGLDYIERVKTQQKNWIGRSTGAEVEFQTTAGDALLIYTTRCDTLFGATYMVLAPEHPYVQKWKDKIENWEEVAEYVDAAARKSDFERSELNKEKTGVRIEGIQGINPVNGKQIPIFISDYVLVTYGTGAIMAVPAHDDRDWEFARKFGCEIIEVVKGGDIETGAFYAEGRYRCHGQLRFPQRADGKTGDSGDEKMAYGAGNRQGKGKLQASRLGFLPAEILGRADPAGTLRQVRLGTAAGGSASAGIAAGGVL